MTFLRRTLIIFGWIVPVVVILTTGIGIYTTYKISAINSESTVNPMWRSISLIGGAMTSLALSPLCFFGAYVLGKKEHKE